MQNPSTKYPLILLSWLILFCAGITIIKTFTWKQISAQSSWIERKLLQKDNDTAIKRLNMSMPSGAMYQELMRANMSENSDLQTTGLIDYYLQLTQAMPWMSDAYTLLGFCYYKQGDKEKAFNMFQKAFYINPDLFYNGFNLSLMFLEAKRIDEATKIMALVLQQAPRRTLQIMASSKVYQDIIGANKDHDPIATLQINYAGLVRLLEQLKNNPHALPNASGLHIRFL